MICLFNCNHEWVTPENESSLRSVVKDFIDGSLALDECKQQLSASLRSTTGINRISDILQCPSEPLPITDADADPLIRRPKGRAWSLTEDNRLICGVHRFGTQDWLEIAKFVGSKRTRAQCAQRWLRSLDPRVCRNSWTPQEEAKLISLVKSDGSRGWVYISQQIGSRSDVQCRYHYLQLMKRANHQNPMFVVPPLRVGPPMPPPLGKRGRPLKSSPFLAAAFESPVISRPVRIPAVERRPRHSDPDLFSEEEDEMEFSADDDIMRVVRMPGAGFDPLVDWSTN
jgi:hypothetical protein